MLEEHKEEKSSKVEKEELGLSSLQKSSCSQPSWHSVSSVNPNCLAVANCHQFFDWRLHHVMFPSHFLAKPEAPKHHFQTVFLMPSLSVQMNRIDAPSMQCLAAHPATFELLWVAYFSPLPPLHGSDLNVQTGAHFSNWGTLVLHKGDNVSWD
ncbi:hypothetical protein VNO77_19205 [Canavalia gladiata]|uniref:Uncharacterized protein n=1 Tax=Canavalia gladiata TaxID=3824 RepID=A0AAN9LR44_CANGL